MKRFESRFERIQHVRWQQERLARATASARNGDVAEAEGGAEAAAEQLKHALDSESHLLHDRLTAAVLHAARAAADAREGDVDHAGLQLDEARARHRTALTEFETARMNLRIVEKLLERERLQHSRETRRREEAEAGERIAQKYAAGLQDTQGVRS